MAYIGKEPIVGNFQKCDALSASGTADYTLQVSSVNVSPESVNHMIVSLNGVIQAPTTAYTVAGAVLSFASALTSSDTIDFVMLLGNVLDIGTPSDGTVTNAKLAQDIISGETELAVAPAATDEFLVSDAGVLKRIDASLVGKGKILQVVTAVDTAHHTSTSTSFVTASSGATVVITPSATGSKIYVVCTCNMSCNDGNDGWISTIYRSISGGSNTNLGNATSGLASGNSVPGVSGTYFPATMSILDSPSTTSACTYQLYVKLIDVDADGANVHIGATASGISNPVPSHITAIEVGA